MNLPREYVIYFSILGSFLLLWTIYARAADWWRASRKGFRWLREARLLDWPFYRSGHGRHAFV